MTIAWPSILVPNSGLRPEPRNAVKSGGPAVSGREQRVFSDAGFWAQSMQIPIHRADQARAWSAVRTRLRMGEDINVKVFEANGPAGFYGSSAAAVFVEDEPLRETQVKLTVYNIVLDPGTVFSIGDRLHEVTQIVSGVPVAANSFATPGAVWDDSRIWGTSDVGDAIETVVKIFPPLRSAVSAGAAVSFTSLRYRGVLDRMESGDLDLDQGRFGTVSVSFIETI